MLRITTFIVFTILSAFAHAQVTLATWNLMRLEATDQGRIERIASVVARFDFVAVQEAQDEEAIERVREAVQRATGQPWQALASHRIGRGSYKEVYGFLWRSGRIEYIDGAAVYLDRDDAFSREPFSAKFKIRQTAQTFVAANVHLIYGNEPERRHREAYALKTYWQWLVATYPGTEPVLFGDFNVQPNHPAWAALKQHAHPLLLAGKTTVSSKEGQFVNLYDNIWVRIETALGIGEGLILNAPREMGMTHRAYRTHVSDHTPAYVAVGGARPVRPAVLGNRQSGIYHTAQCPGFHKMGQKNRVPFESEAQAAAAGYRKAKNCD